MPPEQVASLVAQGVPPDQAVQLVYGGDPGMSAGLPPGAGAPPPGMPPGAAPFGPAPVGPQGIPGLPSTDPMAVFQVMQQLAQGDIGMVEQMQSEAFSQAGPMVAAMNQPQINPMMGFGEGAMPAAPVQDMSQGLGF